MGENVGSVPVGAFVGAKVIGALGSAPVSLTGANCAVSTLVKVNWRQGLLHEPKAAFQVGSASRNQRALRLHRSSWQNAQTDLLCTCLVDRYRVGALGCRGGHHPEPVRTSNSGRRRPTAPAEARQPPTVPIGKIRAHRQVFYNRGAAPVCPQSPAQRRRGRTWRESRVQIRCCWSSWLVTGVEI